MGKIPAVVKKFPAVVKISSSPTMFLKREKFPAHFQLTYINGKIFLRPFVEGGILAGYQNLGTLEKIGNC